MAVPTGSISVTTLACLEVFNLLLECSMKFTRLTLLQALQLLEELEPRRTLGTLPIHTQVVEMELSGHLELPLALEEEWLQLTLGMDEYES